MTDAEVLDAIREEMLEGHCWRKIFSNARQREVDFLPSVVIPEGYRSSSAVTSRLRAAGYAEPTGLRDGFWTLTDAGRAWLKKGAQQ